MALVEEKVEEFSNDLKISVLGRNVVVTGGMKEHIYTRIEKIQTLCPQAESIKVLLEVAKNEQKAEIIFHYSHFYITVSAAMPDIYQAFDKCCFKLRQKLRKWKTRIQSHHNKSVAQIELDSNILDRKKEELNEINDLIEEENFLEIEEELTPPKVMRRGKKKISTLTMDEAAMVFDLTTEKFLVYKEEKDQKLKILCYDKDHELMVLELE